MIRMSSILGGIMGSYLVAWYMCIVNFGYMTGLPFVNNPIPFNYEFAFNWTAFIGVAFIYLITTIESKGDLTATSMLSGEPVEGEIYMERIKGGVGRWSQLCNSGSFQHFPKHNLQSKQWCDSDDRSSEPFCGNVPRSFCW